MARKPSPSGIDIRKQLEYEAIKRESPRVAVRQDLSERLSFHRYLRDAHRENDDESVDAVSEFARAAELLTWIFESLQQAPKETAKALNEALSLPTAPPTISVPIYLLAPIARGWRTYVDGSSNESLGYTLGVEVSTTRPFRDRNRIKVEKRDEKIAFVALVTRAAYEAVGNPISLNDAFQIVADLSLDLIGEAVGYDTVRNAWRRHGERVREVQEAPEPVLNFGY